MLKETEVREIKRRRGRLRHFERTSKKSRGIRGIERPSKEVDGLKEVREDRTARREIEKCSRANKNVEIKLKLMHLTARDYYIDFKRVASNLKISFYFYRFFNSETSTLCETQIDYY